MDKALIQMAVVWAALALGVGFMVARVWRSGEGRPARDGEDTPHAG